MPIAGPRTTSWSWRICSSVRPRPFGVLVGLVEQPGHDAGAEAHARRCGRPIVSPASSRRKWLLPAPLPPEHGDPLAEPTLEVERIGQAVELQLSHGQRPPAGARPAEAHVDALLADQLGRVVALEELAQAALGGLQPRRRSLSLILARRRISIDELLEPLALVLVQRQRVLAVLEVRLAGLVVAGEPAAVRPRAAGLRS